MSFVVASCVRHSNGMRLLSIPMMSVRVSSRGLEATGMTRNMSSIASSQNQLSSEAISNWKGSTSANFTYRRVVASYLVAGVSLFGYLYTMSSSKSMLEASKEDTDAIDTSKSSEHIEEKEIVEDEDDEDDEDDWIETDWSDLPPDDQDKETSCFICLVNREGPCRNYWRRFEKCMDDNPGEDEEGNSLSTKACEKPFLSWMRCQQTNHEYYRERAEIVEYQLWTDDVKDLEDDRELIDFPKSMSPSVEISTKDLNGFVSASVIVPMENDTDHPLVIGYVKNQQGELLGFGSRKKLAEGETEGKIDFTFDYANEYITIHAVYEGDDAPILSYKYQCRENKSS